MRRFTLPALVTGILLGLGGCYGTDAYGTIDYGYGPYDSYYGPDLVYLSPGVSVVAGYNYPVFYSDNLYWRYHDNRWYRSRYYDRGWVYATPPRAVLSIDRPYRYRNYRPNGYTGRQQIRDHRGYQQQPARRGYQQAPNRGVVRQAPIRGTVRTAPVRGNYRNAPVQRQRQAPAPRNDNRKRNIRDHRD